MCGLVYSYYGGAPIVKPLVTSNLARAGRNKGVLTFTPVVVSFGYTGVGESRTLSSPDEIGADGASGVYHLQAPTSEASMPHPAVQGPYRLWHNGIVKPEGMAALEKTTSCLSKWDTQQLCALFAQCVENGYNFEAFGDVEGSFACIAYSEGALWAFRNAIAPLYTDGKNLSSVAIDMSYKALPPGVIHTLRTGGWIPTGMKFECNHNPYGI